MSNELTNIALRRAVAEAVRWKWVDDQWLSYAWVDANENECATRRLLNTVSLSWDDAIAACKAAGMLIEDWIVIEPDQCGVATFDDTYWSNGCTPESLCRALLAAIESRKLTQERSGEAQ